MKRILLLFLLLGTAGGKMYAQTTAYRDEVFTALFSRTSGWTGGELSGSIPLSGGKSLWLFRFSNIDNYQAVDNTVTCNAQVKNAMMVQSISSPGTFTTILDNTKTDVNRTPFKIMDDEAGAFVPCGGYAQGDTAYVILRRIADDFSYGGAYVAKILTTGLTSAASIKSITPLPAMNDIQFGSAVLADPESNYVYIYGSKQNWIVFEPYVARVSKDNILGTWEFYDGTGWTANAAAAQKIMTDYTPTTFSVLYIQGKYYMITQEHNFFGDCNDAKKIISYESRYPYGFGNRKDLFTLDDQYQGSNIRTFEATAHPEFMENNELLVSYNVNNICPGQCINGRVDAALVRPKFIRVPLAAIDTMIGHPVVAALDAPYMWDYAPLPVSFDASASRDAYAEGLTYYWTFGDGATATGSNAKVNHTYTAPGTYTARLIAVNMRGDRDTATTVTVTALQPTTPAHKDHTFIEYFRRTTGWIASDGTISVPLPNGKVIWMFGDSHIDDFDPGTQTIPCLFQVRNAMMVQDASDRSSFVTVLDNTRTDVNRSPVKLVDNDTTLLWPMHGYVKGDTAYLFWIRGNSTSLARRGSYLAKVYWPTLTDASAIKSLTLVPGSNDPMREWGNAVITDSSTNYAYIYGFKQDWIVNTPYVARVSMNNVLGAWEYYDGSGWTTHMNNAQSLLPTDGYVSPSFSVIKTQNKYYLITQDIGFLTCGLGRDIFAYESDTPYGPFTGRRTLYTIEDKYNDSYIITYNATAHPEFMENDELLISYNLNDVCPSLCKSSGQRINPDVYRPRFIRVPLSFLAQGPDIVMTSPNASDAIRSLTVVAYPNPARVNEVKLKIGMPVNSDVQVTVYSLSGKAKQKHHLGMQVSGEITHVLDLSTLPTGTYIVTVKTSKESKTIKLVRD